MEKSLQNLVGYNDEDVCFDYEYDFYNAYLSEYVSQDTKEVLVPVSKNTQDAFMALKEEYSISKQVPAYERNTEAKLADSFMFYVSVGAIVINENGYFINVRVLDKITNKYNDVNKKNGVSLTKGSLK